MVERVPQTQDFHQIDVAVICAVAVEFDVLREKLGSDSEILKDKGLGLRHFVVFQNRLAILVVRLPDPWQGNVASGVVASFIIARYDPWLIVSFGIAGTLAPTEVKALDVLYSRSIFYIDLRKEEEDSSPSKGVFQRRTPQELSFLNEVRWPKTRPPFRVHEVDLCSSEAVVKSKKAGRRRIQKEALTDAKAVEMESFGVFQAAHTDAEAFTRTVRFCLAIKGISDEADPDKRDDLQEQAARNAAQFLLAALRAPQIEGLRSYSSVHRRPRPLQPFIRQPPDRVTGRISKFHQIASPVIQMDWDDSQLHGVHMRSRRPRVFYRWKLTGRGLHWVDFKFVRLLRRLANAEYPVKCLVADRIPLPDGRLEEARHLTRQIVKALLPGQGSVITFYSEISAREADLSPFGLAAGYGPEIRESLADRSPGGPPDSKKTIEFNEWLRYIAWRVRSEGVCIVLHHHPYQGIYNLLWWFGSLTPALVPTADFHLAGQLGKLSPPGNNLFLVPPDYPEIVDWLDEMQERDVLQEFWQHLIAQEEVSEREILMGLQNWGDSAAAFLPARRDQGWIDAFQSRDETSPDFFKGAILVQLAWMNKEFFADFLTHRE